MFLELFANEKLGLSRKLTFKRLFVLSAVIGSFGVALSAQAAEFSGGQNAVVVTQLPSNSVFIRVSGPGEFFVETKGNVIQAAGGELLPDGQYSFEVSGKVNNAGDRDKISTLQDNGRSGRDVRQAASRSAVKVVESGYFRIFNGQVIVENAQEEK